MSGMATRADGERPAYKEHPLWNRAMDLTREAYALARTIRERDEAAASALRKAAVAVPAHLAGALEGRGPRRAEETLAARDAIAELARYARREGSRAARRLESDAADLDARVLFDLGTEEGSFS